jgi:hypothetical protein
MKSRRQKSRRQKSRRLRKQNKKTRNQRKKNTRLFLRGGANSSVSESSSVVFMPRGPGCPRSPMSQEEAAKLTEEDASEC